MADLDAIVRRAIGGDAPDRETALELLRWPDEGLLDLLQAAYRVRSHYYGNSVRVHVLQNAMSGLCSEDCGFCSQSKVAKGPVGRHRMISKEEIVEGARRAKEMGAWRYCIVTSTRSPGSSHLGVICEAAREIREKIGIRVCASLGVINPEQARSLKEAGVGRFNHNLETSGRFFPEVCGTHPYEDRLRTVNHVREAGMEACCGGIVGMGETDEDRADLAYELRSLGVESIPVNFFDPRPGTPFENRPRPEPGHCLRILCMFRFVNPSRDIRAAGGREVNLRSLQPLALYPCTSIFTEGYLTTPGNRHEEDLRMIHDMGFEICKE